MNHLKQLTHNRIFQISLLSALIIILAYIVEIFAKVPPCELCIYQRIPYFLVVFFGVVFFILKKEKVFLLLALILFIVNFFHIIINTITIILVHLATKCFYKYFFFQFIFWFLSRIARVYDQRDYILVSLQFFFVIPQYLYQQILIFLHY